MLAMDTVTGSSTPTTMKCAPLASSRTEIGKARRKVISTPATMIATKEPVSGRWSTRSGLTSRMYITTDMEIPVRRAAMIQSVRHGATGLGRT